MTERPAAPSQPVPEPPPTQCGKFFLSRSGPRRCLMALPHDGQCEEYYEGGVAGSSEPWTASTDTPTAAPSTEQDFEKLLDEYDSAVAMERPIVDTTYFRNALTDFVASQLARIRQAEQRAEKAEREAVVDVAAWANKNWAQECQITALTADLTAANERIKQVEQDLADCKLVAETVAGAGLKADADLAIANERIRQLEAVAEIAGRIDAIMTLAENHDGKEVIQRMSDLWPALFANIRALQDANDAPVAPQKTQEPT